MSDWSSHLGASEWLDTLLYDTPNGEAEPLLAENQRPGADKASGAVIRDLQVL